MLAIARALLFNPRLLVMDEPTEGLAPVIVRQVANMLKRLAADGGISVLLIEQNLGVAIEVADTVDVMVNGRIARSMPAAELAADRDLQQRLLGVRAAGEEENGDAPAPEAAAALPEPDAGEVRVLTVRRSGDDPGLAAREHARRSARGARLHAVERCRSPGAPARPPRGGARRAHRRAAFAHRGRRCRRRQRPRRARPRVPGRRNRRAGRRTSPARSTPRAASSSTCATASRSSACARSPSTSRPRASRRRR